MSTRRGWDFCFCRVIRDNNIAIFRQIYLQIRSAILSGSLRPETKLPSTRDLASALNVSRASVVDAYEQLLAEGYTFSKAGSGTYISPGSLRAAEPSRSRNNRQHIGHNRRIPTHSPILDKSLEFTSLGGERPFSMGRVSLDEHAVQALRKIGYRACRSVAHPRHLGYSDPCGFIELREALCEFLYASRAVKCGPEQIVITTGARQGIDIAIRVLLAPGEKAWVEDPGHLWAHSALMAAHAEVYPVPVDEQGIDVETGIMLAPNAKAVFLTPSHQFPTGVTLSMARRRALLAWARETGGWIVEDDSGSEFSYSGHLLPSLQGLDNDECVIYVGTLNKALFPGIRLGYMVVPHTLIPAFTGIRSLIGAHPSTISQAILTEFIGQGHLAVHIRRMRNRYRYQRDMVAAELSRQVGTMVKVQAMDQGTHLVAYLDKVSDVDVEIAARQNGVTVRALNPLYKAAPPRSGIILGFSGHPDRTSIAAAERLARIIRFQYERAADLARASPERVARSEA